VTQLRGEAGADGEAFDPERGNFGQRRWTCVGAHVMDLAECRMGYECVTGDGARPQGHQTFRVLDSRNRIGDDAACPHEDGAGGADAEAKANHDGDGRHHRLPHNAKGKPEVSGEIGEQCGHYRKLMDRDHDIQSRVSRAAAAIQDFGILTWPRSDLDLRYA